MCIPSTTRCTSLSSLLFILIFIKSHILFFAHPICFAHLTVLLFCTFLYSIAHFTSYFFFLPIYIYIYIYSCVVLLLYNLILTLLFIFYIYIFFFFNSLHCPLSGPDLNYISLLIIPCIIYHVTNKETLTLNLEVCQWVHYSKQAGQTCFQMGVWVKSTFDWRDDPNTDRVVIPTK